MPRVYLGTRNVKPPENLPPWEYSVPEQQMSGLKILMLATSSPIYMADALFQLISKMPQLFASRSQNEELHF